MHIYIIGVAYFFLVIQLLILSQSFLYSRRERKKVRPVYTPKTAVIAPHYGWDENTAEYVKGLLHQDYGGEYDVFFVTHEKNGTGYDVSYPHLQALAKNLPNIHVVLAPNIIENKLPRSQKVQNLLTVIENLPADVEVIAFVDGDVTIREDWLTLLVTPLQDTEIGATVGGRFYFPQTWNFASLVEAVWVNFQMGLQGEHRFSMVWGGSNAFRREFLEKSQLLKRWERATIEDLNTTQAVRDVKLKVHFVPDCVAITRTARRTWNQIIEFTNRQMIMTFHMGLWGQWLASLVMFLPKGVLVFGAIPFLFFRESLLPIVFLPFLEALSYRFFCLNLPRWIREMPKMQDTIRMTSYATSFSMLLAGINALYAIFKRKIVWGGVEYEILSATTCRVLGIVKER